jgi:N-acetylglutamate synthase-like GNAT family acetyltransferase
VRRDRHGGAGEEGREDSVSPITPIEPDAGEEWTVSWKIREATHEDVPAIVTGVRELLVELGGKPLATPHLAETAQALIDDGVSGAVLVAENEAEVVGIVGVSWQIAMRIPGRYGVIQELWVKPSCRYMTIGAGLIAALVELARKRGVERIEVGLPSERFQHLSATEAFYLNNHFTTIGTRMRRNL